MKRIIIIDEELYKKVVRNETLVRQGELTKVDLEIAKFGWDLVDELMDKGEINTDIIEDRDNVNVLYFVNLLKYINLHTIIEGDLIKNLNFAGMEEYSKDMFHKNIGIRPRSYDNHMWSYKFANICGFVI